MEVKGPADSQDVGSNVSPRRRELLRHELADAAHSHPNSTQRSRDSLTPEVFQLTQELKGLPEVRAELVAVIALKLREEYFSTRESAERTAEAILQTLPKE